MKSLTVSCWKIPEGCSKCFCKMKSKTDFSKYVIQNDPEKYHAVNTLSNINSLALFYDWVCYSMDWSLLGYSGQSHVSFPKALPQPPAFTEVQAISCCYLPLLINFKTWSYWNYEKNHKVSVRLCYWQHKSSTWTPQKKLKITWHSGQQAQTKTDSSQSQNNKAVRDTKTLKGKKRQHFSSLSNLWA